MNSPTNKPPRRIALTFPVVLGALAAFWIGATIWAFAVTHAARDCESAVRSPAGSPQNQTQFDKCRRFIGVETKQFKNYKAEILRAAKENQRGSGTTLPPEN